MLVIGQRLAVLVAAILACIPSVFACETLRPGPVARVVAVNDGHSVVLDSGEIIRLAGIQAPRLLPSRSEHENWPLADKAREFLHEFTYGKIVRVYFGGTRMDRHARLPGHVFVEDDRAYWAQKALLAAGLARVYSFEDNRHCVEVLLREERRARADNVAIWSHPHYAIRDAGQPDALLEREGYFELIEGRVATIGETAHRIYLNFGDDREDGFAAVIGQRFVKYFADSDYRPHDLEGAYLRVRGWVYNHGGPRVDITHPEQIEVLAAR